MENAMQRVDDKLGQGHYLEWQQWERKVSDLANKYKISRKQIDLLPNYKFIIDLWGDSGRLEKITSIRRYYLNRFMNGGELDIDKYNDSQNIQDSLFTIADEELKLAIGLVTFHTWITGFVAIGLASFNQRAKSLLEIIKILNQQLEVAQKQLNVAGLKAAVSVACATLTAIIPPVGFITSLAIAGGQLALDLATDGPKKSMFKEGASKTAPFGEAIATEMSEIERYGNKTRFIAKSTGKTLKVVGFYFDADEILIGCRNKEAIKLKLSQALSAYSNLLMEFRKIKPILVKYDMDLTKINKHANETASRISQNRMILDKLVRNTTIPDF